MKHPFLLTYQLLIGISDTLTGALLIVAPKLTLRLMRLHAPAESLPFVSFIGAFVFAVGLSCLYGAYVTSIRPCASKVEVVWLVTALVRSSVAIYVLVSVMTGALEAGWLTVAVSDGACVVIQATGLRRGWLRNV